MPYRDGDHWAQDDRTGFIRYASDLRREWTGLWTADPDVRNPQDFVRARPEPPPPYPIRPEPEWHFVEAGEVTGDDL